MILGIDPGLEGAIVGLREDGTLALSVLMPIAPGPSKGRVVDVPTLFSFLDRLAAEAPVLIVVEAMAGRPPGKMGGGSALTIGANWGRIVGVVGVLVARRLGTWRWDVVQPQRWQKVVCPGTGEPKGRAIAAAQRLCPALDLTPGRRTKPHDGLADAFCIAEWARRGGRP